jgi:putative transposase
MSDWPHAPLHRFTPSGIFFVTAGTYLKDHYYRSREDLDRFMDRLFALAREHALSLQAWAIFSNHYHFVAEGAGPALRTMLSQLHSLEARACNQRDATPGRKVWFQYRETELTFERSWLARLKYTHENAVKHRLVDQASRYRWCSAAWFERHASPAFAASLRRFRTDRVNVPDDFETCPPANTGE